MRASARFSGVRSCRQGVQPLALGGGQWIGAGPWAAIVWLRSILAALPLLAGCKSVGGALGQPVSAVRFTDVTDAAGIRFRHTSGAGGRFYLAETVGSGCAFLDYNNDGKPDLFLVNSSRLPGCPDKGPFYPALYRNNGDGSFTDVTKPAGLAVDCYGMGVAIADYDGDGFQDLYLTAVGPNHLFHNNGDGTFTDVTRKAGVGDPRFSTSAAWFDYDRDGRLDLFVCNYCQWSPESNQICFDPSGRKRICGPTYYAGEPSTLYRNNGDGTFSDVTRKAGLFETAGKALGVVIWDYNDDGWPDLVIAKDREPNLLFRNNHDGTFTERGVEAGIAYGSQGKSRAGMGIDTADTANNGRESILVGNFTQQGLAQFQTDGQGHFTDVADQTGLYEPSLPFLTFGVAFIDYDGDGFKDIIAANGHTEFSGTGNAMRLLAFHNDGAGKFREVGPELGPAFAEKRVWRGLAIGDFDGDGDPDLLVSACGGKPALLRNDGAPRERPPQRANRAPPPRSGSRDHWLQVKAIAAGQNREGIGTKVTVTANGMRQIGWIRSGSSYCSQNELVAFFGLGSAAQAEAVELRYPSGARQVVRGVKANQMIVVQEGKGLVAQGPPGTGSGGPRAEPQVYTKEPP